MESLQKNQTWDLVELPKGRRVVRCKWIFKKKYGFSSTKFIKNKTRLEAKAYSQKKCVNYEIFSSVFRHASIHVLQALVATMDMELEQVNVKTTFLHGKLEEEILMKQPEGFEVQRKEDFVCRLKMFL